MLCQCFCSMEPSMETAKDKFLMVNPTIPIILFMIQIYGIISIKMNKMDTSMLLVAPSALMVTILSQLPLVIGATKLNIGREIL